MPSSKKKPDNFVKKIVFQEIVKKAIEVILGWVIPQENDEESHDEPDE